MTSREFNRHLNRITTDEKSLEHIYDYYYGRIVVHIKSNFSQGDSFATDVAQEFFLYLINGKPKPHVDYPTAWVYKCCDNIALKILKSQDVFVELNENIVADTCPTPIDTNLYGEFEAIIRDLDETTQKIIRLIYIDDYSYKEIAKILGIKYGTVRQKHSRAIKKLKNYLKA